MTLIDDIISGAVSPEEAIRSLALDLGEVESELELVSGKLNQQRLDLRNKISEVLAYSGRDKITVHGFGSVMITAPSFSTKYDAKRLDRLVLLLHAQGEHDLASDIMACSEKTERAGTLRITREKR